MKSAEPGKWTWEEEDGNTYKVFPSRAAALADATGQICQGHVKVARVTELSIEHVLPELDWDQLLEMLVGNLEGYARWDDPEERFEIDDEDALSELNAFIADWCRRHVVLRAWYVEDEDWETVEITQPEEEDQDDGEPVPVTVAAAEGEAQELSGVDLEGRQGR